MNEILEKPIEELLSEQQKEEEFEEWKEEISETIYELPELVARRLVNSIKLKPGHSQYNIVLPMQSGKSQVIGIAAKLLHLEELGYKFAYICSIADKSLWGDVFKYYSSMGLSTLSPKVQNQLEYSPVLVCAKSHELKKKLIRTNQKWIIFIDECHYGDGVDQGAAKNLINDLRRNSQESILVGISATSFGIQNGNSQSDDISIEEDTNSVIIAPSLNDMLETGYRGVYSMLNNNQFEDPGFDLKLKDGLNESFEKAVRESRDSYLESKKKLRIHIIRRPNEGESNKDTKKVLNDIKALYKEVFHGIAKVRFIDVKNLNDFEIPGKDTILVYHTKGGLRAGKRLKLDGGRSIVPYVAMAWESSTSHVAAAVQGLAGGRFCSYEDNSKIKIYCHTRYLEFFGAYEEANYQVKNIPHSVFSAFNITRVDGRTTIEGVVITPKFGAVATEMSIEEFENWKKQTGQNDILVRRASGGLSREHIRKFVDARRIFEENKKKDGSSTIKEGFQFFMRRRTKEDGEKELYTDAQYGALIFDRAAVEGDNVRKLKDGIKPGVWPKHVKFEKVILYKKGEELKTEAKLVNPKTYFSK